MQALFEIYDIDNDGSFGINDLITVIRSFEKSGIIEDLNSMKQGIIDSKDSKLRTDNVMIDENTDSIYVSSEEMKNFAQKLFREAGFDINSSLNFDQFVEFISKYNYFHKAIIWGMRPELWCQDEYSSDTDNEGQWFTSVFRALTPSRNSISEQLTNNSDLSIKHKESDPADSSINMFTSGSKSNIEGYIKLKLKNSSSKKRYCFIKNGLLYYYSSAKSSIPAFLIYLPNRLYK